MAKKINIIANLIDKQFKKQMQDLQNQKYNVNVNVNGSGMKNANAHMNQLGNSTRNVNTVFGKLKNTISETFSTNRLTMFGFLTVLKEIDTAGKKAKETIKEVDKAITDLSIAMNSTREEAAEYVKVLNKQAIELKTTTKTVTDASDAWLRQGKSIEETEMLIKDSLILSKVGKIESADATDYLTSALNGYKLEAEDAISVIDKLTAVDAESASEAGGLALSMSRTASAADMAGISMDKLIGYIATVKEVTRDSDQAVGNMMKTMLSRMNQVKAGKFIDEETGEALNDMEKVLNEVSIAMRDANGQFISSELVLDELGKKFNEFDSVTQRAIATQLGGAYQYEKVIALLSNYSKALEYAEVSANSAGSALKKFESYLGSLEASQAQLQASFESLIMNSDFDEVYAGIIEATTALVDFINKTNALKGVFTGLTLAGGIKAFLSIKTGATEAYIALNQFHQALNLVKQPKISTNDFTRLLMLSKNLTVSQTKLILSSKNLTLTQKKQILINQGLSASEAKLKLQNMGLATSYTGLKAATVSVTNACKGLFSTLLANPIFLITTAISAATMAWQSYKQSVEEAREKAKEAADSANTLGDEISELASKYISLSEAVKTDSSVKEDLISTQTELLKKLGLEGESIDTLISKYGSLSEAIRQVSIDSLKNAQIDLLAGIDATREELLDVGKDGFWGGNNIINATGEEAVKAFKELEKAGIIGSGSYGSGGGALALIGDDKTAEGILENFDMLEKALGALRDSNAFTAEELTNNPLYNEMYDRYNEIKDSVDAYKSSIQNLNENLAQQTLLTSLQNSEMPKTKEAFDEFKQKLIDTAIASEKFIGTEEEIKGTIDAYLSTLPEFAGYYSDEVKTEVANTEQAITSLFDKLTSSKESLDKFTSSVESAYESYAKLMNPNTSSSDILSSIQSITSAISDMGGSLDWEFIDGQANSLDLLGAAIDDVSRKYAKSILSGAGIDVNSKFGQMLANNIIQAQKASIELENLNDNIDSLQSAYSDLTDIVEAYNENHYLTFDQLQTLLELEPQYLSCLIDEEGQLELNEQALTALANQRLDDAEAQAVQQAITELGQLALQDEKTAVEENGNAFYDAISKLASYNQELSTTIAEASVGASAIRDLNAAINGAESQGASDTQVQTVLDNLNAKLQAINSVRDKINTGGLGDVVGNKSSSKSSKDTTESIVWIERAIENLESEIEKLDKIANSAYSSAGEKNQALADQIHKVNEEIQLQQQAYEAYMAKAESVGLSDEYKSLVQNGAITIEDITDEDLKKAIDNYTKWYDKAQDTQDKINDLYEKSNDLHVAAYELHVTELDKIRDNNSITERKYLDYMWALWKKYYESQENLAQQAHETKMKLLDLEKSYLESVASAASSILGEQIDSLKSSQEAEISVLEAKKKPLEEQLALLEDQKEEVDLIRELEDAIFNRRRAEKQRNQLTYVEGADGKGQMVYRTDSKAIKEAKTAEEDARFNITKHNLQDQIDYYDDLIDKTNERYDLEISNIEKLQDEWQKALDLEQQALDRVNFTDMFGEGSISKLLSGDLSMVNQWKQSYLDTLAEIDITSTGTIGEITKQFADLAGIDLSNTSAQTQDIASHFDTLGESVGNVTASIGGSSGKEENSENGNTGTENKEEENPETLVGAIQSSYDVASEAIPAQVEMMNSYAESIHNVTNEVNELISSLERLSTMSMSVPSIGGNAYASGTRKSEKGLALVGEEKPEAIITNDDKVILAEKPSLVNMEGGETVYNGDETEKMLEAKGIRPLRPEDSPILYKISQMNPDVIREKFGIGSAMPVRSVVSDTAKSIANSNVVNNNNKPYYVMNGDVNVNCTGVTSQEVVKQIGTEVNKMFFGMENKARQRANITR